MEIKEEYFPKLPPAEQEILDAMTINATKEEAYKYISEDIFLVMDLLKSEVSEEEFIKNPSIISGRFLGILRKMAEIMSETLIAGNYDDSLKSCYNKIFQNHSTSSYLCTFTKDFVKDKAQLRTAFLQDMENFTGIFWRTLTAKHQDYTIPQNHCLLLPKAVAEIFSKQETGKEKFNAGTPKQPAYVYIDIWGMEDGRTIKYSNKLTPYDKEIYNAIATIADSGNESFTVKQVYDVLTDRQNQKPSKATLERVLASIEKLSTTLVYIDYTDQYQKHKVLKHEQPDNGTMKRTAPLIAGEVWEQNVNGYLKTVFVLYRPPVLYEYAKQLDQILTIPRKIMDVPISGTDNGITIKAEMARRIGEMKNPKRKSQRTILVKTILSNCAIEIPPNDRKAYSRYVATMEKILSYWQEIGWIKSYTSRKEGKRITAFENIRF